MSAAVAAGEIRAAGLIIFRTVTPKIEYLLLQASNLDHGWTPPKGKLDPGETEMVAAQRETQEEAGLSPQDYEIIPGFEHVLQYEAWNKLKTVRYWPAKIKNNEKPIVISDEHQAYKWLDLPTLLQTTNKENTQDMYRKCDLFLGKLFNKNV